MKHSISNIAWPTSEDEKIQDYLVGRGIKAIEIAPSKYWTELDIVDNSKVKEFALKQKLKIKELYLWQIR